MQPGKSTSRIPGNTKEAEDILMECDEFNKVYTQSTHLEAHKRPHLGGKNKLVYLGRMYMVVWSD
jgi:hypothetical protein